MECFNFHNRVCSIQSILVSLCPSSENSFEGCLCGWLLVPTRILYSSSPCKFREWVTPNQWVHRNCHQLNEIFGLVYHEDFELVASILSDITISSCILDADCPFPIVHWKFIISINMQPFVPPWTVFLYFWWKGRALFCYQNTIFLNCI